MAADQSTQQDKRQRVDTRQRHPMHVHGVLVQVQGVPCGIHKERGERAEFIRSYHDHRALGCRMWHVVWDTGAETVERDSNVLDRALVHDFEERLARQRAREEADTAANLGGVDLRRGARERPVEL